MSDYLPTEEEIEDELVKAIREQHENVEDVLTVRDVNDAVSHIQSTEEEKPIKKPFGAKTPKLLELIRENPDSTELGIAYYWKAKYPDVPAPHSSYIKSMIRKVRESLTESLRQTPQTTQTETVTTAEKPSVETVSEPTPEDIKKAEEAATKPLLDIGKALVAGKISKDHVKAIFIIENKMLSSVLGDYAQHDEATLDLLSGLWETPLNRIFMKYADENSDLYIAAALTIYAHLPLILKIYLGKKTKQMEKDKLGK